MLFCLLLHLTHLFFFFNAAATTETYTLSLHDALPISPAHFGRSERPAPGPPSAGEAGGGGSPVRDPGDRKSTRLNSSHANISYAVFCLKKKNSIPLRPSERTRSPTRIVPIATSRSPSR